MQKHYKLGLLLVIGAMGGFGVVQSCGDEDFTEPTKTLVHDDADVMAVNTPSFPDAAAYVDCPTTAAMLTPTAGSDGDEAAEVRVINATDHPVKITLGDGSPVEVLAGVNWPLGTTETFREVEGESVELKVAYSGFEFTRALQVHTGWQYTVYVTTQTATSGDRCLTTGAFARREDDPYLIRLTNASPTLGTTDVHVVADGRIHVRYDDLESMETALPFDATLVSALSVELERPGAATLIYDLGKVRQGTDVLITGDAGSRDGLELLTIDATGTEHVDAHFGWAAIHLANGMMGDSGFSFCDNEGVCCGVDAAFGSRSTWSACDGPRVKWMLGSVESPSAEGALQLNATETSRAFFFHTKDGEAVASELPLLTHVLADDTADPRFARLIHAAEGTPLSLETFTGNVKGERTVRVESAGGTSEVFARGDSVFVQQGEDRARLDLTQVAAPYVDIFAWRERGVLRAGWRPTGVAGALITTGDGNTGEACEGATCADGNVCVSERTGESACRAFCEGECGAGEACAPMASEIWAGAMTCRPGTTLEADLARERDQLVGTLILKADKPMRFESPELLADERTVRWHRPGLVADVAVFDENGEAASTAMVTLRETRMERYATTIGPVSGGGSVTVREKGGKWFFDGAVGLPAATVPEF